MGARPASLQWVISLPGVGAMLAVTVPLLDVEPAPRAVTAMRAARLFTSDLEQQISSDLLNSMYFLSNIMLFRLKPLVRIC
jgi:hypothetical protein